MNRWCLSKKLAPCSQLMNRTSILISAGGTDVPSRPALLGIRTCLERGSPYKALQRISKGFYLPTVWHRYRMILVSRWFLYIFWGFNWSPVPLEEMAVSDGELYGIISCCTLKISRNISAPHWYSKSCLSWLKKRRRNRKGRDWGRRELQPGTVCECCKSTAEDWRRWRK